MREWVRRLLQRPGAAHVGRYERLVTLAAEYEQNLRQIADEQLTGATTRLRHAAAESGWADRELVEMCALGREAARRGLGERPFDVQLLGALGMLTGHVVEMATGEGKTLSGALTAAGHAIQGRRVHVMSVNDYLARRDAEWMRDVYALLGVSVGWVNQGSSWAERRQAYAAEVTYAPVSEVGFDVLRDRLRTDAADLVLPDPEVALVDEADSVMVDEARVPLVLAGAAAGGEADVDLAAIARDLRAGRDYAVDDDERNVHLTDAGARRVEQRLGGIELYTVEHAATLTQVNVALYARVLVHRDVDYLVRDGVVQLINTSRGRVARRQRWPDGLQAAVEAKEGVAVSETGEVLDWIIVQALLGRYPRVCGMTGTAVAVAEQLREFYKLEVGTVPTNRPCVRIDEPDRLYASVTDKEAALLAQVVATHATGRPVLLGTLDVAESERLATRLRAAGVACVVLNAKNDAEEAAIVAEAGTYGAVTISTQMAGRGTDIRLGGPDEADHDRVAALGGLHVIGSGRYHTSRLDDQLRGRAGRQGDPGGSVFFTSLEDDLVIHNVPEAKTPTRVDRDGRVHDRRSQHMLAHAQRVAEGAALDTHRDTWRYNQLLHIQRDVVLDYRTRVLRSDLAARELAERCPDRYTQLAETVGGEVLNHAARLIVLYHVDQCWAGHLAYLTDLREGIHLRALGREAPLDAFHRAAVPAFRDLLANARTQAAQAFQVARITPEGLDLEATGLQRPTATWTYVVHDNPFGTPDERAARGLVALFRKPNGTEE